MNLFQTLSDMFRPCINMVSAIESQNMKILNSLLVGNKLTPIDMLKKFNCLRASARIFDLRKAGWNIKTTIITTKKGKRVAEYSLEKHEL